MTGPPASVSVVVPLGGARAAAETACRRIAEYLETTGLPFEILTPEGATYGAAVRKGAADATGSVIVIADAALPYAVSAIGDFAALIESGGTDIVFAKTSRSGGSEHAPDPSLRLKALAGAAAKLVINETKLLDQTCDLEIAFLAGKYGFRIERLTVDAPSVRPAFGPIEALVASLRIRWNDRRGAYRTARRCPVCFSSEVWTCAQIPGNVVRACRRCKCRYLNQFAEEEGTHPVRRVLRPHLPVTDGVEHPHSESARTRTSVRRVSVLRKQLTARARVLEIGVRDGSFGSAAAQVFEYVAIDRAPTVARHARSRGLEVYCSTLQNFVNTGPAFDAIALFHVFENMADPHDALGRMKDLLKPGGILFLTTFDTEGLLYLLTERKRMPQNFRTHLILYSRSALIELLEHSGFEIDAIGPDFEYRDHKFLRHLAANRWPVIAPLVRGLLRLVPDPLLVSSGSIRIVAKRRAGPPMNIRAIRSVEPTHAR